MTALKPLALAVRDDGPWADREVIERLLAAVEAHECVQPPSPAGPWVHEDDMNRMALERDAARSQRDEAREERTLLRGALEALVAGIEDSVVRFVVSGELQLRSDMEIILAARLKRASDALKETKP